MANYRSSNEAFGQPWCLNKAPSSLRTGAAAAAPREVLLGLRAPPAQAAPGHAPGQEQGWAAAQRQQPWEPRASWAPALETAS